MKIGYLNMFYFSSLSLRDTQVQKEMREGQGDDWAMGGRTGRHDWLGQQQKANLKEVRAEPSR